MPAPSTTASHPAASIDRPAGDPERQLWPDVWLLLSLLLLSGLKLWLVHHQEIVAVDYPADDPWYLISSTNWYWFGSFSEGGFIRQPAYPLWIALAGATGLPLRVATELLFLAAAAAFVLSLRRIRLPTLLCTAAFAFIAFHPFSFDVNRHVLVDSLYAPVLLLSLAGMIVLLAGRGETRYAIWTGVALAVLWHTRQENVLIVVHLVLLGACAAWLRRSEQLDRRHIARDIGRIVLIPAAIVLVSSLVTKSLNYRAFGAFADYELAAPAFQNAYRALLRIEPDPPRRFIPAPREVREQAYAVSPTFRRLRPYFEGPEGRRWKTGARAPGEEGDISVGHMGWALRAAAAWTGQAGSAAQLNAFYRGMAAEIEQACDRGRVQCRSTPFGPFDPQLTNVVPHLPASLARMTPLLLLPPRVERSGSRPVRPAIVRLFDTAANRREALTTRRARIAGWAANPADPVREVSFRDSQGRVLAFTQAFRSRPGLDAYFRSRAEGQAPTSIEAVFDLSIPLPVHRTPAGELVFTLESGRTFVLSQEKLRQMPLGHLTEGRRGSSVILEYAIETRDGLANPPELQDAAQSMLFRFYGPAVLAVTLLAAVTMLAPALVRPRRAHDRVLAAVIVLVAGVLAARVGLFTLIDASSFPAAVPRFLFPVAPLVPCVALLVTYGTLQRFRRNEATSASAARLDGVPDV